MSIWDLVDGFDGAAKPGFSIVVCLDGEPPPPEPGHAGYRLIVRPPTALDAAAPGTPRIEVDAAQGDRLMNKCSDAPPKRMGGFGNAYGPLKQRDAPIRIASIETRAGPFVHRQGGWGARDWIRWRSSEAVRFSDYQDPILAE